MALTAAQRAKLYREKLKTTNPEKYETQKKKQQDRLKNINKKIADLTEEQKIEKRRIWREQKRKQKEKRETNRETTVSIKKAVPSQTFKIKHRKIQENYKKSLKNISKLKTIIERLRKQLYRTKTKYEMKVNQLEESNLKLSARQEILELSLREKYLNLKTHGEKKLLRSITETHVAKEKNGSRYIAKCLGIKGRIRHSNKNRYLSKKIADEIKQFYERDDISRCTAGKKECKTKRKHKVQKRYLTDTLMNLFKIYKKEGGKYSFTTFYKYKPFYVLSPTATNRETCLCIKHSNFQFLLDALYKKSVIRFKSLNDLVAYVTCDLKSYVCMYNLCEKCKHPTLEYNKNDCNENVSWFQWERATKIYKKSGEDLITKITCKQLKSGTLDELISQFEAQIPAFKKHYYNFKEQQRQYRKCLNNLRDNEIAILCDFSENYDCKLAQEIQAMHLGGSKNAITLHTGMIYGKKSCQSFVTLSDNNCHEPEAIWAHLIPVIKMAKELFPELQVIHFFSDGPCSQYRQKKNFYLINMFTTKLDLSYTTWSFSESGHGKCVADGIGGAVKRALDRRVAYGHDIIDASDACHNLNKCMESVECIYIPESEISNIKSLLPKALKAVPGTMQIHQIASKNGENVISYRPLSCFCDDMKGLCDCLKPKNTEIDTTSSQKKNPYNLESAFDSVPEFCDIDVTLDSATDKEVLNKDVSIDPDHLESAFDSMPDFCDIDLTLDSATDKEVLNNYVSIDPDHLEPAFNSMPDFCDIVLTVSIVQFS